MKFRALQLLAEGWELGRIADFTSPIYRTRSFISELRRIFVTLNAPANPGVEHGDSIIGTLSGFVFIQVVRSFISGFLQKMRRLRPNESKRLVWALGACFLIFPFPSSFTFDGVDISVASEILKWSSKRYMVYISTHFFF
jgi:hypothetical protein